jgi:CBS domain containing-hemolysin-like protein
MVAWDRLVTVPAGSTPQAVERLVARTGFSRFPVVSAGVPPAPVQVVGYLHLKDLLYADDERYAQPVPDKRVRALASVTPDDAVEEVLAVMQRSGAHLARVVAGGAVTVGVVFLEDVLEELVGEVRDATQRSSPRPGHPLSRMSHGVSVSR